MPPPDGNQLFKRTPAPGQNISAKIQSVLGGKIGPLMVICESTRHEAFDLMLKQAQSLGANAILSAGYDISDLGEHGTEVICYVYRGEQVRKSTETGNKKLAERIYQRLWDKLSKVDGSKNHQERIRPSNR
jgi:uncharacterized protein YbjQ (UPF0145 family)